MKSILWKEFRENLKWGVLLLLASAYGIIALQVLELDKIVLFNEEFLVLSALTFPAGALALGLMQTVFEGSRDRWAYLLHRGISPEQLLLGKAIAGLSYVVAAAGLPILGMAWWCSVPGHVAAPWFPIAPLLGIIAIFAALPAWFAGVLIGLRDVRWYGSRILPVGLLLVPMASVMTAAQYWNVPWMLATIPISLLITAIYAAAAVGVVRHRAGYERQSQFTRWPLALTTVSGAILLLFSVAMMAYEGMREVNDDMRQTRLLASYEVTGDGRLLHIEPGEPGRLSTVTDPATGEKVEGPLTFTPNGSKGFWISPKRDQSIDLWPGECPQSFLRVGGLGAMGTQIWYFLPDEGVLAGYSRKTCKRIATIGPDSATDGDLPVTSRFNGKYYRSRLFHYLYQSHSHVTPSSGRPFEISWGNTLTFDDGIYRIANNGKATKIYSPTGENPLATFVPISNEQESSAWIIHRQSARKYVFLSGDADVAADLPTADDGGILISDEQLQYEVQFPEGIPDAGVHFIDLPEIKQAAYRWWVMRGTPGDQMQQIVVIADRSGRIVRQIVHDSPRYSLNDMDWLSPVLPPVVTEVVSRLQEQVATPPDSGVTTEYYVTERSQTARLVMWVAGLFSVGVVVLLARRGNQSTASMVCWTVACLVFGPAAVVTLISLRQWPRRERCSDCGRHRPLTAKDCPHCNKAFPQPQRDGTEILLPLSQALARHT